MFTFVKATATNTDSQGRKVIRTWQSEYLAWNPLGVHLAVKCIRESTTRLEYLPSVRLVLLGGGATKEDFPGGIFVTAAGYPEEGDTALQWLRVWSRCHLPTEKHPETHDRLGEVTTVSACDLWCFPSQDYYGV